MSELVSQANTFKSIDELFQAQSDPALRLQLLNRKQKLLEAVDAGKLTAEKYLKISQAIMAQCKIQLIRDATEMEMITLNEANPVGWFKDVVDETRDQLEAQRKAVAGSAKASPAKRTSVKKKMEVVSKLSPTKGNGTKTKTQEIIDQPKFQNKTFKPRPLEPTKIYSLKVLDSLLQKSTAKKTLFMALYQQKLKLLTLIQAKKINASIYLQALQKQVAACHDQDAMMQITMQMEQLNDFHNGDLEAWFTDRLDQANQDRPKQEKQYKLLKQGKSLGDNLPPREDDGIDQEVEKITSTFANKNNLNLDKHITNAGKIEANKIRSKHLFCFYYLDEQMALHKEDIPKFCSLYEEKLACLQLLQKGTINAGSYREMIGQLAENDQNEDMKEAAQMEIDMNDATGDADQFFKGAINETGAKYEQQTTLYQQYTNGSGRKLGLQEEPSKDTEATGASTQIKKPLQTKKARPNISEIVSLTVLVQFLEIYKSDYDYCVELKEKGEKLIKLVNDKKLGPNQYIRFLQSKIADSKDQQIVSIMKGELCKIQQAKQATKQFRRIVDEYLSKVKIDLGDRKTYEASYQFNQLTINEAEADLKIKYLISKLAKYESLLVYYKKNKLERHLKQFQPHYETAKKKTLALCQQLKASKSEINVREYAETNLPDISFALLHRESRNSYNQRIAKLIQKIQKSNIKIVDYTKAIKKSCNKANLEQAAKLVAENNKTIAYLQSLYNKDLVPFPNVEETKLEMYNIDLNKNLKEDELQIIVANIQQFKSSLKLQIYMVNQKEPCFVAKVYEGPQVNTKVVTKVPPQIMADIIKGSQTRYLHFRLVAKGWVFSETVGEASVELNFVKSNRMEERVVLKPESLFMDCIFNVHKPKKPIMTEIPAYKLTQFPEYAHDTFIETEFVKTVMPYENPTKSELV